MLYNAFEGYRFVISGDNCRADDGAFRSGLNGIKYFCHIGSRKRVGLVFKIEPLILAGFNEQGFNFNEALRLVDVFQIVLYIGVVLAGGHDIESVVVGAIEYAFFGGRSAFQV